jgi:flagellar biosynthesis protein FlhG
MARIITITSGKGGVGKTSISLNLSLSLASEGFRVCLFDADLGLANVNILTGITPKKDLTSVISGQARLDEIIIKNYQGIDIIPGSSGVEKIADLTRTQTGILIKAFLELDAYDYFLFDTSAGISAQVISFCMASHEIILVATCEPTSLTDAYSLLKVLSRHKYQCPVKIVINQVTAASAARKAYAQLKTTVQKFLSIKVEALGVVGSDKNVRAAVISQTPFFMLFPDTLASRCIQTLSRRLMKNSAQAGDMPLEFFWDTCLAFIEKHHKPEKKSAAGTDLVKSVKGPEIQETLFRIESTLSNLIKAVDEIKQLLEQGKPPQALVTDLFGPGVDSPPEKIELDFESWLAQKNTVSMKKTLNK